MVRGVHRGDDGQQHLRRADVAGRLLPADVLFPGLQRQPVGRMAVGVHRHPDQPPRELALQTLPDADITGLRAAEAHRDAEPLGGAHRDVSAELAGRNKQGQRQQVGRDGHQGAAAVRRLDHRARVADRAARPRVRQQHPEQLTVRLRGHQLSGDVPGHELDAERLCPSGQHGKHLGQAVLVGKENPAAPGGPPGQGHRLGRRGGLVQHRRAGQRQRGQVLDHRLEVEQRLEAALRDLRLVGRVGRVPGRVLQQVAPDHGRRHGAVVAEADHRCEHLVPARQAAELGKGRCLAQRRRQRQLVLLGEVARQRRGGQFVQRAVADGGQHLILLWLGRPDVPLREIHEASPGWGVGGQSGRPPSAATGLPLCRPPGGGLQRRLARPVRAA